MRWLFARHLQITGRALPVALIALAVFAGCERQPAPAPAPAAASATTSPSAPASPSASAATQPATAEESVLTIDGRALVFPPARIRIETDDGRAVAMLFSDDPKDAIDRDYAGNSYYLELTLELSGPDEKIDGAEHASESGTSEREDSPYGIFLQGRRWILQPDKLRVTLSGEPPDVTADLAGVFLLFDTEDPTTPPRPVPVQGQLHAAAQHR